MVYAAEGSAPRLSPVPAPAMQEQSVRSILASLLRTGLLRIRNYGADGIAARCRLEADHLHNLPETIASPTVQNLSYYFDVERPAFLKEAADTEAFEADWRRLQSILDEMR